MEKMTTYPKDNKNLLTLLIIYFLCLSLCRMVGPSMRYISYWDWGIYRHPLIARMPYYLMPLLGILWLQWSRCDFRSLLFIRGLSFVGALDHGYAALISFGRGLPFFRLIGNEPPVRVNVMIASILAVIFAILSLYFFRLSKKLFESRKATVEDGARVPTFLLPMLLLLFCYASPYIDYKNIANGLFPEEIKEPQLFSVGSDIRHMTASPDGKLLVLGAEKGLFVWDALEQQCVWSDDRLGVQKVRFSDSGKYLAVAGRGVSGGSDVAVFDVDGFKRLKGFEWIEEEPRKEKIFHDIAFRPDEKSLLFAWHKTWAWNEMSKDSYREAEVIRKKEREELIAKKLDPNDLRQKLICSEWSLISGETLHIETIESLSLDNDLLQEGSIYFLPKASHLQFPLSFACDTRAERSRFMHVDTQKWIKTEKMLSSKYSMLVSTAHHWWHEWCFSRQSSQAYFLASEYYSETSWNKKAFLVLNLNFETEETQEIYSQPVTRSLEKYPWSRMKLSPDESMMALLGYGEAIYRASSQNKVIVIRLIDLRNKNTSKFFVFRNNRRDIGWRLIWINADIMVVSLSDNGEFFFLNIKEG